MAGNPLFCTAPSPESVGISSRDILRFISQIETHQVAMHGFLFIRHQQLAAEAYWPSFHKDQLHRIYSASKSVVGLAVGCMVDEGEISLSDPVVRFFPDKIPNNVHPYLARTTIRDLLVMATPHTTNSYTIHDKDWTRTFFEMAPSHPPGTIFSYDTAATVVLGAIIERLSGLSLLDYLRPRLLDPISFSPNAWCIRTPGGISWGGSGILCTLRDLSRLALLCMNKGAWGGRQLISRQYMESATSRQIDTSHCPAGRNGYGYQIWTENDNGFSFRGKGSQLVLCWPERDFIFSCFADTQSEGHPSGTNSIVDAMQRTVYESLSDGALSEDPDGLAMLQDKISSLCWRPLPGRMTNDATSRINKVLYRMNSNPMGFSEMCFEFQHDEVTWLYTNGQGSNRLKLGIGRYTPGRFPQKGYFGAQIGVKTDQTYACLAAAMWAEQDKLNCRIYITDCYLGTLNMTFFFRGDEITVWMNKHAEWFLDEYQGFAVGRSAD
ncbi:MAG: serine hydrolase [Bacillota bacterium]|nr:serine hydrolase [Bacillota bacterium]